MTARLERLAEHVGRSAHSVRKPTAYQVLRNLTQATVFGIVEVLALAHLDGWLWWAMFVIVVRNAWFLLTLVLALSVVSADALRNPRDAEAGTVQ